MVPLLKLRPLARLPRRAGGVPLLPTPALARAVARGRLWRVEGHRHGNPHRDAPSPLFLLALHGPAATLWQAIPHDDGRRQRLVPCGARADSPKPPARRCPALTRLIAQILGADGPRLQQRQTEALLEVAKAAGAEDACAIVGLRAAKGPGIICHRSAPCDVLLILGKPRRVLSSSELPAALRTLLRQDPGELQDDHGLTPQTFLSVRPAVHSAHARLTAQERLRRRYGPTFLEILQSAP